MRKEKHAPPFFRATSGVARFGYTESQIIPNTSKKASNSGISLRNIRDNFLVIYTVSFPKSLA